MNTKTLSTHAFSIIDQYVNFTVGTAVTSVPYFNNRTVKARAALRATIGKGSAKDIFEETDIILKRGHIEAGTLASEALKKLFVENNIGIDCSAFAFYVLDAESKHRGAGSFDRHLSFVNCRGPIGKIRCLLRPIENCDVATFAHDKNSSVVALNEIAPGDVITMIGGPEDGERDHILVVHQVEYQNFVPYRIHYSHAVAYPEDGLYGTGVKQGSIEIADVNRVITAALWKENGKEGENNRIFMRAQKSKTEVRRLKWF